MVAVRRESWKQSTWARWCAITWRWKTAAPSRWSRRCPSSARLSLPGVGRRGVGGAGRYLAGGLRVGATEEGEMKRRTFVKAAAAGVPSFGILSSGARAQSKEIRMIESGGKSGESIEVGYIEPFTKKTGIKVVRESPNPLGKLRAMGEG